MQKYKRKPYSVVAMEWRPGVEVTDVEYIKVYDGDKSAHWLNIQEGIRLVYEGDFLVCEDDLMIIDVVRREQFLNMYDLSELVTT